MCARLRLAAGVLAAAASMLVACSNPLGRQYEYDEQIYLSVDGTATVVVNASLPALVALRGAAIDPGVNGTADRDGIRKMYADAGCSVSKVGRFWYRRGRRFTQIEVSAPNVHDLSTCALLSWSSYSLSQGPLTNSGGTGLRYTQTVGPPSGGNPGAINWDGSELVAFKLHAPSRIKWQNVRKLEDGTPGSTERGNILTWEQLLSARVAGAPLAMEVEMDSTSILYTTLWLFFGAFAAAVLVLVFIIWLVMRRGRRQKI